MEKFTEEMEKWSIRQLSMSLLGAKHMADLKGKDETVDEITRIQTLVLDAKCSPLFCVKNGKPEPTPEYFELCKDPQNLENLKFAYEFMLNKCKQPIGTTAKRE